ncbi:uncharacterized protein LOC118748292 [Rhagoletis pomonella]|uniref:uncharacterized protein LOC118748292 n=1 Tax=Rhagoletis pomonella TaxID=28610 RepID=UPI00177D2C9C|nr:uncharacterized protein LOC118748292 [Rhagoletis pomonella]
METDTSVTKFSMTDVENVVRKYSGVSTVPVTTWIEEFEAYATAFRWNAIQKFVFAKKFLSGAAKMYVECEAKPVSYDQLKQALTQEFQLNVTSCDVHKKLRETKKLPGETCRE